MLDAGLPRKQDPEDSTADMWTAPSYFDITLGGLGDDFGARALHGPCALSTVSQP